MDNQSGVLVQIWAARLASWVKMEPWRADPHSCFEGPCVGHGLPSPTCPYPQVICRKLSHRALGRPSYCLRSLWAAWEPGP